MSRSGDGRFDPESDAPTPPVGLPLGEIDASTPPSGLDSGLISAEDFGKAGPAVLGAPDDIERHDDAGDWPTLEYRSRDRPERGRGGAMNWLRRRRGE
ncbi:hypothetical protein [Saccharopolyspora taberi]|uniref:Uncharacterized protein n=1 Tax=Saccharopolyspora taberi TaxID=60895 RepID=A0ABN3V7K3_9PSEU